MKFIVKSFIILFLCSFVTRPVSARELKVCNGGCAFSSLQQAIDAASAGDTILLDVHGVFTENGIRVTKNVLIRGLGQTATILQAHAQRGKAFHRIFLIDEGALVAIENLTLKNGKESADPTYWKGAGGAILVDGSATSLNLTNVTIANCDFAGTGNGGGAIALGGVSTSLNLSNCVLDNNISNNGGAGAIYLAARGGDCFIRGTLFKNNIADNGNGGAVLIGETVSATFIGCSFNGNQALNHNSGGAVYSSGSIPTFNNCAFNRNLAEKEGGALKIGGGDLANCSFYFNTAENGGAICRSSDAAQNELNLLSCTLLNNSATGYGPAIAAGLFNGAPTASIHMVQTVIDKSISGFDVYSYAASSFSTNQKNTVGKARFSTGSIRFASN